MQHQSEAKTRSPYTTTFVAELIAIIFIHEKE